MRATGRKRHGASGSPLTPLLVGDELSQNADIHLNLGREAGSLGRDLGPVVEFTSVATHTGTCGPALRLLVGVGLLCCEEPARVILPTKSEETSLFDPASEMPNILLVVSLRVRDGRPNA